LGSRSPPPATKIVKPGIDESAYRWTEIVSAGAGRSRVGTTLRQLKQKTAMKVECRSGKTLIGEMRLIIGDDLFLTMPDQSVPIAAINRMWKGEAHGT